MREQAGINQLARMIVEAKNENPETPLPASLSARDRVIEDEGSFRWETEIDRETEKYESMEMPVKHFQLSPDDVREYVEELKHTGREIQRRKGSKA